MNSDPRVFQNHIVTGAIGAVVITIILIYPDAFTGLCTLHIVLVLYEFLITFSAEVNLFWRKKFTGASILLFINHYVVLFYNLFSMWSYWPITNLSVSPLKCALLCYYYTCSQLFIDVCTILQSNSY